MFSAALLPVNAGHALPLLLDVAAKGLLVSALALAALLCLRRASAATRHLILLAGLGVLLGLPVLMALLPRQEFPRPAPTPRAVPAAVLVPAPPTPTAPPVSDAPAPPVPALPLPTVASANETPAAPLVAVPVGAAPVAARPPLPAPPAVTPSPAHAPSIRPGWLVALWLVGVLACAARMLSAQARVWRLTRRCPPLPPSLLSSTGLETAPFAALLTGPTGTPPMVWGWPRAVLLLPPEAADWPDARLRAVVLHESAHVRRCDWLTHLLAQAACALYWFNPLLWLLAARLGAEAERACDDAVLLAGVAPTDYAQDLLAVARHLGAGRTQRRLSVGAVTMTRRSPVRGRLEAILDTRRARRRVTRRSAALAVVIALAVAAPLAILRPAARADEGRKVQAALSAGVPTEADIAKVQQHLQGLEKARADYAAAHPNTLTAAQVADVDRLIYLTGLKRGRDSFDAREKAEYLRAKRDAKKPHSKPERQEIWRTIFGYENTPPSVLKRDRAYDLRLAQLKRGVDASPAEQVARETRLYALDSGIALSRTREEAMLMEQAEGYSLHLNEDDIASMADLGFQWEKKGWSPRAATVHVFLLFDKLKQQKSLDDADIDSLIAILREPSRTPSVARTNVMGLFHRLPDASPAQRQKICEAVTPFLTSEDKWERKDAGAVLRKFGGSAPTPPVQKAQAVPAPLLKTAAFDPPADDQAPAGQAVPTAGVPTEADITKVRQHLRGLEQERGAYAVAHHSTLTPAQSALVDRLCSEVEEVRYRAKWNAGRAARESTKHRQVTRVWVEGKSTKPNDKRPLRRSEMVIVTGPEPAAPVAAKVPPFNPRLARLQREVGLLPPGRVAQETRKYGLEEAIALDETRLDIMQMERAAGLSLHITPDDAASMARYGLDSELAHSLSRTDLVHLYLLDAKIVQAGRLSEADIAPDIAILRTRPDRQSPIHLAVLFFFDFLHIASPAQSQEIREAILPYLASKNYNERYAAKRALRWFGGSAPTPPARKAQAVPAVPHQAALLRTAAFAPPSAEGQAGQAAPLPGVPTETDIARARQRLQDLEKARADYTAAHPGTLSRAQTTERETAKTALRMQIIRLDKSMAAGRQGEALRTPAVVAFEEKRHQREEQTYTDMDQIRSADAKGVLYPAQAAHWKQVSASAAARLRRRQAEIKAMRPPTPEAAAEVARYDSYLKSSLAARGRWMQLESLWHGKYAPRRLSKGTAPAKVP